MKSYLDYPGLERVIKWIRNRYDKKLDSVTNFDESVKVVNGREIAVQVSESENNILQVKTGVGKGLFVPATTALHRLTFGPYQYDGSRDVTVAIYDGEYIF